MEFQRTALSSLAKRIGLAMTCCQRRIVTVVTAFTAIESSTLSNTPMFLFLYVPIGSRPRQ
jgi:hypothetical protein